MTDTKDIKTNHKFLEILMAKGGNKTAIGKALGGVSGQLLGQYVTGRQKPKEDFFIKWEKAYNENIRGVFNETNVSTEVKKEKYLAISETQQMQAIADLARSSISLADANKTLADNNSRLIALLEQRQVTAETVSRNQQDVLSIFDGVLDALAEIASGKKFHSKEEAVVELNKMFYLGVGK